MNLQTITQVRNTIAGRSMSAAEIAQALSLKHEDVYGALVWLEGQGMARALRVKSRLYAWEAL